ncbi:MAG: hypothetical protein AB1531_12450, partial [Chloroflexota bacterium]
IVQQIACTESSHCLHTQFITTFYTISTFSARLGKLPHTPDHQCFSLSDSKTPVSFVGINGCHHHSLFWFFGVFRLGAYVDIVLIISALFLIVRSASYATFKDVFEKGQVESKAKKVS